MTHSHTWRDVSSLVTAVATASRVVHVTWPIHTRDMTHSYVRQDLFMYVTWHMHICAQTHMHAWHDSSTRATGLATTSRLKIWHYSCIRMTWLIYSSIYVIWCIHICDMTHSHMCQDSYTCVARLIHTGNRLGDGIEGIKGPLLPAASCPAATGESAAHLSPAAREESWLIYLQRVIAYTWWELRALSSPLHRAQQQ